jgi:hypothetical protein
VRDAGFLGLRWTRREDTQFGIYLHRICIDDRPTEAFGDFERERGFAAGRGAGDQQGGRQRGCRGRHRRLRQGACEAPIMIDVNLFLAFAGAVTVLMMISGPNAALDRRS